MAKDKYFDYRTQEKVGRSAFEQSSCDSCCSPFVEVISTRAGDLRYVTSTPPCIKAGKSEN